MLIELVGFVIEQSAALRLIPLFITADPDATGIEAHCHLNADYTRSMPQRVTTSGGLSSLVRSDSESDSERITISNRTMPTSQSQTGPKRGRGRPPAGNRVTKPAPKSRTKIGSNKATAREALSDKSNTNTLFGQKLSGKREEHVEEMDTNGPNDELVEHQIQSQQIDRSAPTTSNSAETGRQFGVSVSAKRQQPFAKIIASPSKSQDRVEAEDVDVDNDTGMEDNFENHPLISPKKSGEEFTSEQDVTETSLRRRLGELTRKYENLEARHKDLRELGIKDAERNYERLRKQTETSTVGEFDC